MWVWVCVNEFNQEKAVRRPKQRLLLQIVCFWFLYWHFFSQISGHTYCWNFANTGCSSSALRPINSVVIINAKLLPPCASCSIFMLIALPTENPVRAVSYVPPPLTSCTPHCAGSGTIRFLDGGAFCTCLVVAVAAGMNIIDDF